MPPLGASHKPPFGWPRQSHVLWAWIFTKVVPGSGVTLGDDGRVLGTTDGVSDIKIANSTAYCNAECTLNQEDTLHKLKITGTYSTSGSGSGGKTPTWDATGTTGTDIEVDLVVADSDNTINPKICLNAQNECKKAKFKAVVKPDNSTATVSVQEGSVSVSPTSVKDGDTVEVTGNAIGKYVLKISHDMQPIVSKTVESVVFELKYSNEDKNLSTTEDYAWKDEDILANRKGPPTYWQPNAYSNNQYNSQKYDYNSYAKQIMCGTEFTFSHLYNFGIASNPGGAFNGDVSANIEVVYDGNLFQSQNSDVSATAAHHIVTQARGFSLKGDYSINGTIYKKSPTNSIATFQCNSKDASLSSNAHTCTQTYQPDIKTEVKLNFTITLNNFKIK